MFGVRSKTFSLLCRTCLFHHKWPLTLYAFFWYLMRYFKVQNWTAVLSLYCIWPIWSPLYLKKIQVIFPGTGFNLSKLQSITIEYWSMGILGLTVKKGPSSVCMRTCKLHWDTSETASKQKGEGQHPSYGTHGIPSSLN